MLGGLIIAGAGAGDGWRWVFLVNLLIGAVAVPVAAWLLPAGLGSGIVIAPNQDFALARVPSQDAGTAGAILGTAQRVGGAVGIAVIGTILFGSLHVRPGPSAVAVAFSHAAQVALLANVGFIVVALSLVLALPRQIPSHEP